MDASRAQAEATRLLPLAQRALKRYPFLTREVTHLATHSNILFRVVTESGEQMVLRVGAPHGNTRSNIEVEVAWLDAINRDTSLEVVRPIRTAGRSLIVDEYDEGIDKERSCVLYTWIPGQPMADGSGTFAYRLLGAMAASLQAHGKTWTPPPNAEMRRWDRVFYYQADFDPIIIENPLYSHLFDIPRVTAIRKAIDLAEGVIADSYASAEPQVVHGDLHEWNVHLAGSRLYAFDFEDVMMALPAQDVATCLYSSRNSEIKEDIRAAFRRGYEAILPWPVVDEAQLDGFHAARQIMLMNYAGRTLRMGEAADYIDHVMPWLERYVKRYE
ncbi:MAG: phosphotransferase [Acidimicrobiia bacterium]|jgi:Ser/Thr protein kinase RdoA (MazF antagonist)